TGAIPRLDQATKATYPIGKAYIDQKVCIPWSGRADCIVCEEMCPLPDKAIKLEQHEVIDTWTGEPRMRYFPVVRHDLCIGCGLCEQKCPVNGEAAIRVVVDPMLY
ncbi:MAG: 4Fe-4S dicluster domain-containing protein, partial [Chloroflexi bacterium]|nr:4Fe-4S dicluster domain-containing protein [Chloroflexota bacterium]